MNLQTGVLGAVPVIFPKARHHSCFEEVYKHKRGISNLRSALVVVFGAFLVSVVEVERVEQNPLCPEFTFGYSS